MSCLRLLVPYLDLLILTVIYPSCVHSQYWSTWFKGHDTGDVDSTETLSSSDGSYITKCCTKSTTWMEEIEVWFDNGEYGGPVGQSYDSTELKCFEVQENECFVSINLQQGSLIDGMQMVTSNGRTSEFWGTYGGDSYVLSGIDSADCISQLQLTVDGNTQGNPFAFRGIRAFFITITTAPTPSPTSPSETPTNAPTAAPSTAPSASPSQLPTKTPTNTPTVVPTNAPTNTPSNAPTMTDAPTTRILFISSTFETESTSLISHTVRNTVSPMLNTMASSVSKSVSIWTYIVYILSGLCGCACVCLCVGLVVYNRGKRSGKYSVDKVMLPDDLMATSNVKTNVAEHVHDAKLVEETKDNIEVKEWMTNVVQLPHCYGILIANGYENMEFIMDVEDASLLMEIGIVDEGEQKRIITEIQKLKNVKVTDDGDEWSLDSARNKSTQPGEADMGIEPDSNGQYFNDAPPSIAID